MHAHSFSVRFRDFERARERLWKIADHYRRRERQLKLAAYRMAESYVAMQKQDHNALLDLIRSHAEYAEGPDAITRWIDDSFAPFSMVGGSHYELIQAIEQGMTPKQYLSTSPALYLNRNKIRDRQERTTTPPSPAPPTDDLPLEEQLERWKARAIADHARNEKFKADIRQYLRRIALLEKEIKKLRRIVDRIEV